MIDTATGRARREPELGRRLRGEPACPLAHRPHRATDAREALVGQLTEADLPEVALVPALGVTQGGWGGLGPPNVDRYVHLHAVVQSERTSLPVAR